MTQPSFIACRVAAGDEPLQCYQASEPCIDQYTAEKSGAGIGVSYDIDGDHLLYRKASLTAESDAECIVHDRPSTATEWIQLDCPQSVNAEQLKDDLFKSTTPEEICEVLHTIPWPFAFVLQHKYLQALIIGRDRLGRRSLLFGNPEKGRMQDKCFLLATTTTCGPILRLIKGVAALCSEGGSPELKCLWAEVPAGGVFVVPLDRGIKISGGVSDPRMPYLANRAVTRFMYVPPTDSSQYDSGLRHMLNGGRNVCLGDFLRSAGPNGGAEAIVDGLIRQLRLSVNNNLINPQTLSGTGSLALLFSGGVDSTILASLMIEALDEYFQANTLTAPLILELVNVAFDLEPSADSVKNDSPDLSPDRITCLSSVSELLKIHQAVIGRSVDLRLIFVDVKRDTLLGEESNVLGSLWPCGRHMDFNIGAVLHFAALGEGYLCNLSAVRRIVGPAWLHDAVLGLQSSVREDGIISAARNVHKHNLKTQAVMGGAVLAPPHSCTFVHSLCELPTSSRVARPEVSPVEQENRCGCCRSAVMKPGCLHGSCSLCCGKLRQLAARLILITDGDDEAKVFPANENVHRRHSVHSRSCLNPTVHLHGWKLSDLHIKSQEEAPTSIYYLCPPHRQTASKKALKKKYRESKNKHGSTPNRDWVQKLLSTDYEKSKSAHLSSVAPPNLEVAQMRQEVASFALHYDPVLKTSSTRSYSCTSSVFVMGSGADELLGGYGRHAVAAKEKNDARMRAEMLKDFEGLVRRNLSRDSRCFAMRGREMVVPFLDPSVVSFIGSLPVEVIMCRSYMENCSPSAPKWILRDAARILGLNLCSQLKKRAMQFGSNVAKLSNSIHFDSSRSASGNCRYVRCKVP